MASDDKKEPRKPSPPPPSPKPPPLRQIIDGKLPKKESSK